MRILFAVSEEAFEGYLAEMSVMYPEEEVLGNAPAFNVLMQWYDERRPDVVVMEAGLPGTAEPEKYAPKGMADAIRHMHKRRARTVMLTNGVLVKEQDRNKLRAYGVTVVEGDPVPVRDIAMQLGLPVFREFQPPVVSAFSLKGGVGKSTLAANLAVRLAKAYVPPYELYSGYLQRPSRGMRVLVWDLDFQSSDMGVIFSVPEDKNIYRLFADNPSGKIDVVTLTGYIHSHPSGVDVLAAPPHDRRIRDMGVPDRAAAIMQSLLRALLGVYHAVIFDLPNEIITRPHVESALRLSTAVASVMQPNARSLKSAVEGQHWLTRMGHDGDTIHHVMNRNYSGKLDLSPFEAALGSGMRAILPEVRSFDVRQDSGEFAAEFDRGYAAGLDALVSAAFPSFSRAAEPRGGLSGLMRPHGFRKGDGGA